MIDLRSTRDTFVHLLADNLDTGIPVHPMRRDPQDRQADVFAMNAVNVEFLNFSLGNGASMSWVQAVIDVINDDENTAVDWITAVGRILTAQFFTPIFDYTNTGNPVNTQSNLVWQQSGVAFKKVSSESYAHFTCTLRLQFRAI